MKIAKEFTFDSAHRLPGYKGSCANLHGHTYKLRIYIKGPISKNGMVMDFSKLKKIVKKEVLDKLDHAYLNKIIKQPTAENILVWVWKKLAPKLNKNKILLTKLILWETPTSFAVYEGNKDRC